MRNVLKDIKKELQCQYDNYYCFFKYDPLTTSRFSKVKSYQAVYIALVFQTRTILLKMSEFVAGQVTKM